MKNFIMIESVDFGIGQKTYSISDARKNTNFIVQYDTTFEQIFFYAQGYVDALSEHDGFAPIFFKDNVKAEVEKFIEDIDINERIITEQKFQEMRMSLEK